MANLTGKGTFQKGKSGNPGGRPKAAVNIALTARSHAPEAIKTLVEVARKGKNESARISAAVALLDRGYGKPQQSLDAHFTSAMVTKRLSELTDQELMELETRIVALGGASDDDGQQSEGEGA